MLPKRSLLRHLYNVARAHNLVSKAEQLSITRTFPQLLQVEQQGVDDKAAELGAPCYAIGNMRISKNKKYFYCDKPGLSDCFSLCSSVSPPGA